MKKIIIILLVIFMSSCSKKEVIVNYDSLKMESIAMNYLDDFIDMEYEDIYQDLDDKIKKDLSVVDFKNSISNVLKEAGAYQKQFILSESKVQDNLYLVSYNLDYVNKNILLTFSFDMNNKISGIWLNYANDFKIETNEGEEIIKIDYLKDYPLNALLTKPLNADGDVPCVIMIQGSGQSDLDETIGLNKPFKDIANGLKNKGIATIRYDKRYFVYPELANSDVTVEDEILNDIYYLIDKAKTIKGIDEEEIYILGHSLGAMLVPYILSERNDLKGAIIMAGSPRNLVDIIKDQNTNQYNELINTLDTKTIEEIDKQLSVLNEEIEKIKILDENSDMEEILLGASAKYWYSLNQKEGFKYLDKIDKDLFILQGKEDFQVFYDVDYQMYYDTLKDNEMVKFKLYDNLNHLMMPTNGKRDITEYNTQNHVSSEVIGDIVSFIKKD